MPQLKDESSLEDSSFSPEINLSSLSTENNRSAKDVDVDPSVYEIYPASDDLQYVFNSSSENNQAIDDVIDDIIDDVIDDIIDDASAEIENQANVHSPSNQEISFHLEDIDSINIDEYINQFVVSLNQAELDDTLLNENADFLKRIEERKENDQQLLNEVGDIEFSLINENCEVEKSESEDNRNKGNKIKHSYVHQQLENALGSNEEVAFNNNQLIGKESQAPIDRHFKNASRRNMKNVSNEEKSKNEENERGKKRKQKISNVRIMNFVEVKVDVREGKRLRSGKILPIIH